MNVEDLRTKEVKDLTDEEKQFLVDNKAELTDDERTKFEIVDEDAAAQAAADAEAKAKADKEAADVAAAEEARQAAEAGKGIEASAIAGRVTELEAQLKASREESEALRTKIDSKEVNEFLDARVKAGQIKQDQRESWANTLLASRGDARAALETQLQALPANETIGKELGGAGIAASTGATEEMDREVRKVMASAAEKGKPLGYYAAQKQVFADNPSLQERVNNETEGE